MEGKSLFALLAGAAAGLTLGVLFAPAKGEETRAKIRKAASEGYDDLKEGTEDLAHDIHVRARYARKEMNSLKKTLAEQGAALTEEARAKIVEQLARLEKYLSREEDDAEDQPQL